MHRLVPKAELHCHIEGAAQPAIVFSQALKYGVDVSAIVDEKKGYLWDDFTSFLKAYDFIASLFRSPEDYVELTRQHYLNLARQGCLYAEVFASPDHAARIGCDYRTLIEAIAQGIDAAREATGVEGRIIVTGVRHSGVEAVEEAAKLAVEYPHPLVTGFGMAGDERVGEPAAFKRAFDMARDAGLGITCHAGEFGGAESVRETLDHLKPSRIGHGVRAIEDPDLVRRIADSGIVLEVCPVSNVVLEVFPSLEAHPLPQLVEAGCAICLNSDDPPHFHTSLMREYEVAHTVMGYDRAALTGFTVNALKAAFVDGETRMRLLEKCAADAVS